jgi:hypothetical protein
MPAYSYGDYRNGYIINNNNDTIRGEVARRNKILNYQSCKFREKGKVTVYLPDMIRGYGIYGEECYNSYIIPGSFTEELVTGYMSLYRLYNIYIIVKDGVQYKIENKFKKIDVNGVEMKDIDNSWKGVVSMLVFDCFPDVQQRLEYMNFSENDLMNIVLDYNRSKLSAYKEFKTRKPRTAIEYGFMTGVSLDKVRLEDKTNLYRYMQKEYKGTNFFIGGLLTLTAPRVFERISLEQDALIYNSSYSGSVIQEGIYSEYNYTEFSYMTLSLPTSLRYSIPGHFANFYFNLGVSFDFMMSGSSKYYGRRINYGVETIIPEKDAFDFSKFQFGYWGGAGSVVNFKYIRMGVNFRYFKSASVMDGIMSSLNPSKFMISFVLMKK